MSVDAIFSNFREELLIPLLATEETDDEHTGAVDREQSPRAVELAGEDFEHNKGK
jgi:hypothetical protein